MPRNQVDGGGRRISVAQVVSSATIVVEPNAHQRPESASEMAGPDPTLVKRLLIATAVVAVALAFIVFKSVTRQPQNSKNDAQAIDAGGALPAAQSTAAKWVNSPQPTDAQLRPGVKVSTPTQVPVVPAAPDPTAPETGPSGPRDVTAAADTPAPQMPNLNLSAPPETPKPAAAR